MYIIHVAAFAHIYKIVTGAARDLSPEEIGTAVCTFTAAGLTAVGKLLNITASRAETFTWAFTLGSVFQATRKWFSKSLKPNFRETSSFS